MSQVNNRFFCESITEPITPLTGSEAHHLTSVLRLKVGDKIELFNGKGVVAKAVIVSTKKRDVTVSIEQFRRYERGQKQQIILATSIPKADRFDWLIAKATELGVDRITPVIFERTVKLPNNPKILTRWQNITISSAKQCRRVFLPQIDKPTRLAETVENLKNTYPDSELLLASPEAQAPSLTQLPKKSCDIIIFVGPEGGMTDTERQLLIQNSTQPVRLTSTILRVETAAIAAAVILSAKRDT
ncbi:RsmE family RNA methyltransferase [Planctomycetota bacterium]